MSQNTIILADNSYTIRRIVELSFGEEDDLELISFETGRSLQEKLLEIKPDIVLVDIKLPEWNGYEVCKFINENDDLKATRVFLMKGGFEPIEEDLLKELTYVDIITKPFDSNALVSAVKNILSGGEEKAPETPPEKEEEEIPSSVPEDIPEIDGIGEAGEDISFSDIQQEIESEDVISDEDVAPDENVEIPKDEVLPSEEKTQGSPPEKDDKLAYDNVEDIDNPFKDDQSIIDKKDEDMSEEERAVKQNIKAQEEELEIGSVTRDEIDIKKMMAERKQEPEVTDSPSPETDKEETSDGLDDALATPASEEDVKIALEDETEIPEVSAPVNEIELDVPSEKSADESPAEKPSATGAEEPAAEPPPQETDIPVPESPPEPAEDAAAPGEKERLVSQVQDNLTVAVKEMLWEIVPPLAERIIKEEINKLKAEIDKSVEK